MTKANLKKRFPVDCRVEICDPNPWKHYKGVVLGHKKVKSGQGVHIMLECDWDIIVTSVEHVRRIDQ